MKKICLHDYDCEQLGGALTFVLVPGGWCGGWCWKPVADILRAAGHRVFSLTLTGVGERSHLLSSAISLETHVQDIINTIIFNDLENVVLVGHSYAGLMLTVVLDRIPERLRHVVYLDAMLPFSGECLMDLIPSTEVSRRMLCAEHDGGVSMPAPTGSHFATQAMRDWFQDHLTPHPIRPYFDKIYLEHQPGNGRPVTYVACTPPKLAAIALSGNRARDMTSWRIIEIASGHNVHLHRPNDVAHILLEAGLSSD